LHPRHRCHPPHPPRRPARPSRMSLKPRRVSNYKICEWYFLFSTRNDCEAVIKWAVPCYFDKIASRSTETLKKALYYLGPYTGIFLSTAMSVLTGALEPKENSSNSGANSLLLLPPIELSGNKRL
jgi:hypothetical protein